MRCLTGFTIYMWLLVLSRSRNYWLGISPHVTVVALVDVKVFLGIPSCGTHWVPRGSRGLILGSTGRGRRILGSIGRGRPLLYPASVFPTIWPVFGYIFSTRVLLYKHMYMMTCKYTYIWCHNLILMTIDPGNRILDPHGKNYSLPHHFIQLFSQNFNIVSDSAWKDLSIDPVKINPTIKTCWI